MGSKKRRSKISCRNQNNTEKIRGKDRERKKKKRAILRGEEVANQPMMGESNAISNRILVWFKSYAISYSYI